MRIITRITAVAFLVALLAACTQDPYGIFASIERERRIEDDRNLREDLSIMAMAKLDATYFVAAGGLYYRNEDTPLTGTGTSWDKPQWAAITTPTVSGRSTVATSLVAADLVSGESLYVVLTGQDGSGSGLYRVNLVAQNGTTTPVLNAVPVFSPADATGRRRIDRVFTVTDGSGDWLVVSASTTASPARHRLYASADGQVFTRIEGDDRTWMTVSVVSDGTDVAYLSAGELLVHAGGLDPAQAPTPASPTGPNQKAAGAAFTGLMYEPVGSLLWLADNKGRLYTSDDFGADPTGWTRSAQIAISTNNDAPLAFTTFAAVPTGADRIVVVGTDGHGYRVIGPANTANASTPPSSPDTPGSNYQGSGLATASVLGFFVDPEDVSKYPVETAAGLESWNGHLLFVSTYGRGLWRTLSSPSGPNQWVRE